MIVGYARVSTDGQTLDAQQAALAAAGAEQLFAEKVSGAVTARKALAKALAALGPGDVLLVTRLDRLARSTRDLLDVIDTIAKAGAGFRSLADAWADTTTPHVRLMLTVLGGLAEFERELIRARTDEGRKRAQARGVLVRHSLRSAEATTSATLRFRGSETIAMLASAMALCRGSKRKRRSSQPQVTPLNVVLSVSSAVTHNGIPARKPIAPSDGHNSLCIMTAPITGDTSSGDGESDRGRALHRGDESGPDFIASVTSRT